MIFRLRHLIALLLVFHSFRPVFSQDRSGIEILIPKESVRKDELSFVQKIISAALQKNAAQIQREYQKQVAEFDKPFEKQRTLRYPVLNILLRDEATKLRILSNIKNRARAEELLKRLQGLVLVIDITFRIDPHILSAETDFPLSQGNEEQLLRARAKIRAVPQLKVIDLSLGLENFLTGDKLELSIDSLLAKPDLLDLQSSEMRIDGEISALDNISAHTKSRENTPLLKVPLVGLKSNLKEVTIPQEKVDALVQAIATREQLQEVLNVISDLSSWREMMELAEEELKADIAYQLLNLEILVVYNPQIPDLVGPQKNEFEIRAHRRHEINSEEEKEILQLKKEKRLLFQGYAEVPLGIENVKTNLNLKQLRLVAEASIAPNATIKLQPRYSVLTTEVLSKLPKLWAEIFKPLLDKNLATDEMELKLNAEFATHLNRFVLPLKWVENDLQWNSDDFSIELPFIESFKAKELSLQWKTSEPPLVFQPSGEEPLDLQILKQLPGILRAIQFIFGEPFVQSFNQFLPKLITEKVEEIGNKAPSIQIKTDDIRATISVESFKMAADSLKLNFNGQSSNAKIGAEITFPTKMKFRAKDIWTKSGDINEAEVEISSSQPVKVQIKTEIESREWQGKKQYRLRYQIESAELDAFANSLEISDLRFSPVEVKGFTGGVISAAKGIFSLEGRILSYFVGVDPKLGAEIPKLAVQVEVNKIAREKALKQFADNRPKFAALMLDGLKLALNGKDSEWVTVDPVENDEEEDVIKRFLKDQIEDQFVATPFFVRDSVKTLLGDNPDAEKKSDLPAVSDVGVSGLTQYLLTQESKKLEDQLKNQKTWRSMVEGRIKNLFFEVTEDRPNSNSGPSFIPSNAQLRAGKKSLEGIAGNWIAGSFSGNAEAIEEGLKQLYESTARPSVENLVTTSAQKLATSNSNVPAVTFDEDQPLNNISTLMADDLLRSSNLTAVIYFSYINKFIKENLGFFKQTIETKVRSIFGGNHTFTIDFYPPAMTDGQFITLNLKDEIVIHMGVHIEQETILLQKITSLPGMLIDGLINLFAPKKINFFEKAFSLIGVPPDFFLGFITDLDTRGPAELKIILKPTLANGPSSTEEHKAVYLASLQILSLEIYHRDPVTPLTWLVVDKIGPEKLKDFVFKQEIAQLELPTLEGYVSLAVDSQLQAFFGPEDQSGVAVRLLPVFSQDPTVRPTLRYDPSLKEEMASLPLPNAQDANKEKSPSKIAIPLFSRFGIANHEYGEVPGYRIFGFLRGDQ